MLRTTRAIQALLLTGLFLVSGLTSISGQDPGPRQSTSVEVTINPGLRQVDPGTSAIYTVTVRNLGDVQDVMTLDITEAPTNWTVLFTDSSIALAPGETETVSLSIRPSADAPAGDRGFTVTATSTIDTSEDMVDITVRVSQVHSLKMFISQVGTVAPGGTTSYTVTVTNDGNGPDTVTLNIIPMGEATSWASITTRTMDLEPGESEVHTQTVDVPSDTDGGTYYFTIRARSSGTGGDETEQLEMRVKGSPSSEFVLETWMLALIMIIVFLVIAVLAAIYTPARRKEGPPSKVEGTTVKKVRKVKRKGKASKEVDKGIHDRFDRMEKRIEQLHDHFISLDRTHKQMTGHFQFHLIRHHGDVPDAEPDQIEMEGMDVEPKERGPTDKDGPDGAIRPRRKVKEEHHGTLEPTPMDEVAPAEGPPENMSVGDEVGEIREGPMPIVAGGRCPNCGGKVEEDYVRCPDCSHLL